MCGLLNIHVFGLLKKGLTIQSVSLSVQVHHLNNYEAQNAVETRFSELKGKLFNLEIFNLRKNLLRIIRGLKCFVF